MTKNIQCRRQVVEVLQSMNVGDEFILTDFIEWMRHRKSADGRNPTIRQPSGRVATILGEWVLKGILERTSVVSRTTFSYRVLKLP
jgi:hypothetical protein